MMCYHATGEETGRSYLGKPDRTCRPSTFWLMRYLRYPALSSPRRAMWVKLGRASSNVVSKRGDSPFSSNVHTPFGPLKENTAMDRLMVILIRIGRAVMQWVDWRQYVSKIGVWVCIHGWILTTWWEDFCKGVLQSLCTKLKFKSTKKIV